MEAIRPDDQIHCRAMWISDVHLGSTHSKAKQLLQLLDRVHCDRLYLVGDIVDLLAMRRRVHWPQAHNKVVRYSKLNRIIGDIAYDALMRLNRWVDKTREWLGKPYWSLAKWVKKNSAKAEQAIDAYQLAAINMAKDKGYDGIICGHLHYPTIRQQDGVLYCNDGDWVENCSALIEDDNGNLRLIRGESHPESIKRMIFIDATDEFTKGAPAALAS